LRLERIENNPDLKIILNKALDDGSIYSGQVRKLDGKR
jgi:hypothetical protein